MNSVIKRVGLLDLDNHELCKINKYRHRVFPNIALMKFSTYYRQQGCSVEMYDQLKIYDLVLVSKVFNEEYTRDYPFIINAAQILYGGTGYGIDAVDFIDEFDRIMPDYSLYDFVSQKNNLASNAAVGFITRGCPRNCPFCIVSKIEGTTVYKVADLTDFVLPSHTAVKLCDPNILAYSNHIEILKQLVDSGLEVDFNQGLDVRLINEENLYYLSKIKVKRYHFAWDNPKQDLTEQFKLVSKYLSNANKTNHSKLAVYVLVNFNSLINADLKRIYKLRDLGFSPYVMIYNKSTASKEIKQLQRYVNKRWIFRSKDCPSFDAYKHNYKNIGGSADE